MMTNKEVLSARKRNGGVGGGRGCRKCVGGGGSSSDGGNGGGESKEFGFKKGPWTPEEDAVLKDYVRLHGEKQWNCVQKTGLMRCGKSCRLRWTNHLRPNLKKGAFTPEEERTVLHLHAKLGNKWSKIAAELPGRTDNEVKNFWNTKIKRKLKAKLLTEPQIQDNSNQQEASTTLHLTQQQQQRDPPSLPSSPSFTSLHFSPTNSLPKPTFDPFTSLTEPLQPSMPTMQLTGSMQYDPIISFLNNPAYKFEFQPEEEEEVHCSYQVINGLTLPFSPVYSSITNSFFPTPSLQLDNSGSFYNNSSQCLGICNTKELPSSQFQMPNTPPSTSSFGLGFMGGGNEEGEKSWSVEGNKCVVDGAVSDNARGEMAASVLVGKKLDGNSPVQSFTGMESRKELLEGIESMDDDLSSLLNNFSAIESPPEWHLPGSDTYHGHHNQAAATSVPGIAVPNAATVTTTSELDRNPQTNCCWSNLPGIH